MRQMRFTTVQELKSQPKLLSWLYAKDLVMIACFVCVMSVFQGFVHPALQLSLIHISPVSQSDISQADSIITLEQEFTTTSKPFHANFEEITEQGEIT